MDQQSKRRRAQMACNFCRHRKMRCGNEKPSCVNCVAYHEVCKYDTGPKKARPSNSRILKLEEENRNLQKKLSEHSEESPPTNGSRRRTSHTPASPDDSDSSSSENSSGVEAAQEKPEYHGKTSMFSDYTPAAANSIKSKPPNHTAAQTTSNLTGEAAAQSTKATQIISRVLTLVKCC